MLAMDCLRWLTVRALRGRTWAGLRVYDSPATPADLRMEEERAPFIAVYCDDADVTFDGQSINGADVTVDLLIEVAVASTVMVGPDTGDTDTSDIDVDRPPQLVPLTQLAETDESLEALIGWITAQCEQALISGDNRPWGELWRTLTVTGRVGGDVRRGGAGQQGEPPAVRFASRLTKWRLKILADPIWGQPINGFWGDFIAACEADAEMADIGKLVRAHIERPGAPVPEWELEQAKGTWTLPGVSGLGIATAWWPRSGEPAPAGGVGTSYFEVPPHKVDTTVLEGGQDARGPFEGLGAWAYRLDVADFSLPSPVIGVPALTENP